MEALIFYVIISTHSICRLENANVKPAKVTECVEKITQCIKIVKKGEKSKAVKCVEEAINVLHKRRK